jgi:hypothetical protein
MVHCCTLWISSRECSRVAPRRRWPVSTYSKGWTQVAVAQLPMPMEMPTARSSHTLSPWATKRRAPCFCASCPLDRTSSVLSSPVPRLLPVLVLRTRVASADSRLAREAEEVHPQLVNSGARLKERIAMVDPAVRGRGRSAT